MKYMEAILSNCTWKLLWFEMTKMLIAVLESRFIFSFSIIFGTLLFCIMVDTLLCCSYVLACIFALYFVFLIVMNISISCGISQHTM